MNNEIFFGRNSIRFYYYRYRDSAYFTLSVILLTIAICGLLFFKFILPQLDTWFSIRNEVIATRGRIATINNNISYLQTIDRNQLSNHVSTVSDALPPEKNFGAILDAMTAASLRSGVFLQDYSFQVGSVSSSSGQLSNTKIKDISGVSVSVVIDGTIDGVAQFIKEIAKTLPLSEVTTVDGASGSVMVTMEFYQKTLPTSTLKDDQPIPRVIETNTALIDQLSGWKVHTFQQAPINPTGEPGGFGGTPLF